jgi:hypothetical protein
MIVTSFTNRISAFTWGFACCWIAMLLAFTWIFVRDGAPEGIPNEGMAAILGFFWLGGLGLAHHAMNSPLSRVTVDSKGEISLAWQYPHRRVRKTFAATLLGPPALLEYRDSDGDPYFRTRLTLPDGGFIDIAEGHDRDDCERARERFLQAVGS